MTLSEVSQVTCKRKIAMIFSDTRARHELS